MERGIYEEKMVTVEKGKAPGLIQFLLRGFLAVLLVAAGTVISAAVLGFEYEPPPGAIQILAVIGAAGILVLGAWGLLLGADFRRRAMGAHGMAAAGVIILVALAGADPVAWAAAATGWGVVAGMTVWGYLLFGGRPGARRLVGVGEEGGR